MTVRIDIAGRKFGWLTAVYRSGERTHRIFCRCVCSRLLHVAARRPRRWNHHELWLPTGGAGISGASG